MLERDEMLQIERIVDVALMEALEEAARQIFGDEKIKWEDSMSEQVEAEEIEYWKIKQAAAEYERIYWRTKKENLERYGK